MGRVVMVTWDGGGNLPPMLCIGGELRRRGHEVSVLGHERQRGSVTDAGLEFIAYRHARPFTPVVARDPISLYETFADGGAGRDLSESLAGRPADLVVGDCLMLGPLQAAQAAQVPTVVLFHTFYAAHGRRFPQSPIAQVGGAQGRLPGPLWDAADEVIVPTDRALDPDSGPISPNVHWTGVAQDPPARTSPRNSGRILLSLSTVWFPGQQESLQTILDALAGLDASVVATAGPNIDAAALSIPANVEFHAYLAHHDVMPTVSLVIGHGGHATTMLALAHDLPLLIVPQFERGDQPMIGEVISGNGAGLTLPQQASVGELRKAINTLLRDDSYARAAAAIGARLRDLNGTIAAADRIEGRIAAELVAG